MDNETRVVNGIIVEEYLISAFLLALTKRMNGLQANMVLDMLGNGDIDLFNLLGGDVSSKKDLEHLKKENSKIQKSLNIKIRELTTARDQRSKAVREKSVLSQDIHNYISAIRYYEDTLEAMGCRRDILRREDLGKIFDEDEEDGWG